jgi:hypothetical protein
MTNEQLAEELKGMKLTKSQMIVLDSGFTSPYRRQQQRTNLRNIRPPPEANGPMAAVKHPFEKGHF